MQNQGVEPYEQVSSFYREIVLHPFFEKGHDLTPQKMDMFHMVFYNLDKFRDFILSSTFTKRFEVAKQTLESIKKDDLELMKFGVDWLKFALFGEDTIKITGEVSENEIADA